MTADTPLIVGVTRRFTASPERVLAWLDTKLIGAWMFGPGLRELWRAWMGEHFPLDPDAVKPC